MVAEPLDLTGLIRETAALINTMVPKNTAVEYHLYDDLPRIEADAGQLRRAVMSLASHLSDALGEAGGIIVFLTGTVTADRDYLSSFQLSDVLPEGRYVYLEVADAGIGTGEEATEDAFGPPSATQSGGRGGGLAAIHGIVREHGGAIRVASVVGSGTTVTILFPVRDEETPAAAPYAEPTTTDDEVVDATVLIVDDEKYVQLVAKTVLEERGYRILVANDGCEGVRVFREHCDENIVVLLDVTMPLMDGEETYREMRRIDPNVRVILTSGHSERDTVQDDVWEGLAGFIQKPYQPATLVGKVREMLGA